jgi:hypothetical protein
MIEIPEFELTNVLSKIFSAISAARATYHMYQAQLAAMHILRLSSVGTISPSQAIGI